MHENIVRHFAPGEMQHRRPEQRVKVNDVLADEVILLDLVVGHEFIKAALLAVCLCFAQFEIGFEAGQIADRRIQPYVKVLSRRVGNFDAKVGRVA